MALRAITTGSTAFGTNAWGMMGFWGVISPAAAVQASFGFAADGYSPVRRWRAASDRASQFPRDTTSRADQVRPMTVKGKAFLPMDQRVSKASN